MTENLNPAPGPPDHVVRCFWHGPFSPYEALCLSSFVAAGIAVELFSEAPIAGLPAGVTLNGLGAMFTTMDERSRRSLEEFLRKASQ